MTSFQLTLPVSGAMPAVLTLPLPLTPQALRDLDQAVSGSLGMLLRDLCGDAAASAQRPTDAGAIEYASWMPDPGALEMASWATQLQPTRQ
jgi:hypothetical protein